MVNVSNTEQLKNLSFQLKQEVPNLFCLLVMENANKPFISLILDEALVNSKQWHAGNLVKLWAKHIQGGGGGQAFYATAGGNNLAGLEIVLKEAEIWLEGNL
jgi:alanyl-tRNA synthetase